MPNSNEISFALDSAVHNAKFQDSKLKEIKNRLENIEDGSEEIDLNELKQIHEELVDRKEFLTKVLQHKGNRANQLFRYSLILTATLITIISFLFQSDILKLSDLNNIVPVLGFSFLIMNMTTSLISNSEIRWDNEDFKTTYDLSDSPKREKSHMLEKIKIESNSIKDISILIKRRTHLTTFSRFCLASSILILAIGGLQRVLGPVYMIIVLSSIVTGIFMGPLAKEIVKYKDRKN